VTGAVPQLKVMVPPLLTAELSAPKVQLAGVPVPTTVVGFDVSAGVPAAGMAVLQEPLGLPAIVTAPVSGAGVAPLSGDA
jgi:hypothetical protein